MLKRLAVLSIFFALAIAPTKAFATLYINEFSSSGDSDWVEIYNSGSDSIDLSQYRLRDSTDSNSQDLSGSISGNGFAAFDWSNRLNNDGDKIRLIQKSDDSQIDEVVYGVPGDIGAPSGSQTAGRNPDGTSNWVLFSSASRGASNNSSQSLSPTPMPSPTNTPTPTNGPTSAPTATPTKAPTATPRATIKPSPTDDPNSDLSLASDEKNDSPLSGKDPTPTDEPEADVLGASTSSVPVMFIVLGLIILAVCGILAYFQFGEKIFIWKKKKPL